jgi:hypothetical protein
MAKTAKMPSQMEGGDIKGSNGLGNIRILGRLRSKRKVMKGGNK